MNKLDELKLMKTIEQLEVDKLFTSEIEYNINNNIVIKSPIYNYCQSIFSRILFKCDTVEKIDMAIKIQRKYFGNITIISAYDYEGKLNKLEEEIHKTLCLDGKCMKLNKEDVLKLSEYKLLQYKNMLNIKLRKNNKEMLIQYLYMATSIISWISMTTFHLYKCNAKDADEVSKTFLNLIVDTIGIIYNDDYMYLNDLFAKEKKAFEYLIQYILNTEIEYLEYSNEVEIQELIEISSLIFSEITINEAAKKIYKIGHYFELVNGKIVSDSDFLEKQKKYIDRSLTYQYKINNNDVDDIIEMFQDIEKYSPLIYEKYIVSENKFLRQDVIGNFIESELLKLDIKRTIGLSDIDVQKLLDNLSLRMSSDVDKDILKDENRLFLTPFIKVGKYYLLSSNLMVESAHYLRKRILKGKLSNNNRIKKNIENKYDEVELQGLSELIKSYGIISGINKSLQVNDKTKKVLYGKGITKEIDLYFIEAGVLNIVEYKNHELARNVYEIVKHCDESENDVKKYLRMTNIIDENKELFFDILGGEFYSIKKFFIFKNPNPYIQFCEREDIIVMEYVDFYEMCLKNNWNLK